MIQTDVGEHDVSVTFQQQSQAEIDVVVCHGQFLVEAAGVEVAFFGDHHAGAGHGGIIGRDQQAAEITGTARQHEFMAVVRDPADPERQSRMLDRIVGIEQNGAHGADAFTLGLSGHFLHPVGRYDFNVVVQENEDFSPGMADALVVEP